jgi:2-polyprenyl-6-methoxyphenol hydroxylase-like FAD-dependent oxidoreductase
MALPAFLYTPSGTFLIFAMDGAGDKIQWATSVNIPERDRRNGWDELRTSGEALEIVKNEYKDVTAEPIQSMIRYLTNDNLRLWAPYTVPEIPRWHSDRVCILGDASHAISPSVGQGSAQAFEDIGLLARLLASPTAIDRGFPALFSHFEKIRRPRVRKIQQASIRAESSRGKTGWLMWTARSWVIWLGLKAFGKDGYVKGDLFRYNVMKEDINVM